MTYHNERPVLRKVGNSKFRFCKHDINHLRRMKIMMMLMIINVNLRKSRGDHAKEDHHVEANKTLGGKDHGVKLTITKGHIPKELFYDLWRRQNVSIES